MKSQTIGNQGASKLQESVENDLMGTIGVHVNESARAIFNIKQFLYELVKLNVTASVPIKKYETNPAILAGSKRNLDDLRRIQSMLKGYLNTIRIQSESNSQDGVQNQIQPKKHSHQGLKIPVNLTLQNLEYGNYSVESSTKNSPKNILTGQNFTEKLAQSQLNTGNSDQKYYLTQMQLNNLRQQNQKLKKQLQNMKQLNLPRGGSFEQNRLDFKKQAEGMNQRVAYSNAYQKDSSKKSEQLIINLRQKLQKEGEAFEKQVRKYNSKKLQNCKSAIFETSRNLNCIRSRNKICLQIIKSIKHEIGLGNQIQSS